MEGTVKWFNTKKGYGFVKGEDDQEYFVHHSALGQGVFLRDNDRVSFDPAEGEKGKQAQNVQLLQKGSEVSQEGGAPEESKETPQPEEKPTEQEGTTDFGEEEKTE